MVYHYRVRRKFVKYIRFVLERDGIPYVYTKKMFRHMFAVSLSKEEFGIVLEDAQCELERERHLSHIPVYSLKTFENKKKLERLMALNNRNDYQIMRKDERKFRKYYCN